VLRTHAVTWGVSHVCTARDFHGAPEQLDAALRWARDQTLPDLARLPGFKGLYVLVDRQTGKGVAISLWQTEAALHASEDVARPHRAVEGRTQQELAVYEVAVSPETPAMPTAPTVGVGH
jgi:heme-degrading monooxygenase HmoA